MALIVQKYGGTSVGSVERIQGVAKKVAAAYDRGDQIVVVVSAMSGETNRLIEMAQQLMPTPDAREYSTLVSTGEQVTIALLSMALQALGYRAKSYTGGQVRILTGEDYKKARIHKIDGHKLEADLAEGIIPVVAGFQGVDQFGNITTLGRGGSDTTGVALAAALKADECQIFTDVDGVYTCDPRVVPSARRLKTLVFEEMLELASLGAKVLQIRSVEFAGKYKVPLRVLSTFEEGEGTLITFETEKDSLENPLVVGIAFNRSEAKLTVLGVPDKPGVAAAILSPIGAANIDIDIVLQNMAIDGTTDFTFTVHRDDYQRAYAILETIAKDLGARQVSGDARIAKISLVGLGMRSHAGVASMAFEVLGREGINIRAITTSEIKVSIIVDEKYMELGVRALHTAFGLDADPEEEFDPQKKLPQ